MIDARIRSMNSSIKNIKKHTKDIGNNIEAINTKTVSYGYLLEAYRTNLKSIEVGLNTMIKETKIKRRSRMGRIWDTIKDMSIFNNKKIGPGGLKRPRPWPKPVKDHIGLKPSPCSKPLGPMNKEIKEDEV